jgi:hypothetical protein
MTVETQAGVAKREHPYWLDTVLGRRANSGYGYFATALALALGYAYLLAWFGRTDFYHHEFFAHGGRVTAYQVARLLFTGYLGWTICAVGAFAVSLTCGRSGTAALSAWERWPLCFVVGAGVWHIAMFALGLASFDIGAVAITLSLGTMALSVPHLAERLHALSESISRVRRAEIVRSWPEILLWLGVIGAGVIFLIIKGLYPGGGHDYYNHYFQFYKRVVDTGSILPNDVWYQFYYSKGAGLYFLGMLLTDALAPQLVTTCFIACGAGIVYALLRSATRSRLLPLVGVLLYISIFIYTPGPVEYMVQGGWGIMEKIHELTAVLSLAVVWIAYRLFRQDVVAPKVWTLGLHCAIVCIALLTLPLTLLVGLYVTGYLVYFVAKRQWRLAVRPFMAGVTSAVSLLGVCAINYGLTGLPSDMLTVQFWPYANLDTLAKWGTLLEVLVFHHDVTVSLYPSTEPISWKTVPLIASYLRLELWGPLFLAALPCFALQMSNRSSRQTLRARLDAPALLALGWFAGVVILTALFGDGRTQPISFYRISTFCYAPTLCLALVACHLGLPVRTTAKRRLRLIDIATWSAFAATLTLTAFLYAPTVDGYRYNVKSIFDNALNFTKGRFSLFEAYQHEQGWSGTMPWGGIYPGIIEPWRIVGPHTRLWSFHIHSYCMLPDCRIEEFFSERLSPSWQTILFGTPDDAAKALQSEGSNYFFFSSELTMSDPLKFSPLFAPQNIGKYLAIRWTDGTSYLLTWRSANTTPIDRKFLLAYAQAYDDRDLRATAWRGISVYLEQHRSHLQPFFLPWCTNCQGMPRIDWQALELAHVDASPSRF